MYKQSKNSNIISNFTKQHIDVSDSESESDLELDSNNNDQIIDENNSDSDDNKSDVSDDQNNELTNYDSNDDEKEQFHKSIQNKKDKKNKIKKITTTREYLNHHKEYSTKYEKFVVLMCVGIFYEAYAIEDEGPDLYELGQDLNITVTKKNKSKALNEGNPRVLGFPIHAVTKFMKILLDYSYTVIIIDQIKNENVVTRKVTGIYSPSTYIESIETDNKYLSTFYIEANSSLNNAEINYCVGMCSTDLTTGDLFYYESYDNSIIDENNAIEEANRFYYYYKPVEIVVYLINNTQKEINFEKILNKIDISSNKCVFKYTTVDKSFLNINYQNKLLKKVYKNTGLITPISYLDLEKFSYSTISICLTFDFIHSHNTQLLNSIKSPIYFNENKFLVLGNGAQYQLDVVDYSNSGQKNHSLYSIINFCKTPMGKRFLKNRLCAPLTDSDKINKYYEYTENLIENELYLDCRNYLANIADIKKLFRKINVNSIHPYQLYSIYESCISIKDLYDFLNKSSFKMHVDNFLSIDDLKSLNKAIKYITKTFNISKIIDMNLIDIKQSFYNIGANSDIDDLTNKINGGHDYFEKLKTELSNKFGDTKFHIKHNDRDGYYLSTTKVKGVKLIEYIKNNNCEFKINNKIIIKSSELVTSLTNSSCKITCPSISKQNIEMNSLFYDFDKLVRKTFIKDINDWYLKYSEIFDKVILFVTEIDYISNNAYFSNKYHYCKPIISLNEKKEKNNCESFVISKQMRHPIIEKDISHEYVPHDVCLNKDVRGNLIYGVNSCGKSSLMKSIGINIILAQCGLFVPATEFEFYPFKSLYTRITANDDMKKGHSSFIVELNELGNILKKSDKNTLIIGDEICRGTEYLSANSLVAASIIRINNSKAKYIFATHLHELVKLEKIKNLKKLKMFHLSIQNINTSDELIFNRKLIEGNGEEVYGIAIAKHILNDPEFINMAIDFKNEFLKEKDVNYKLMSDKKSNYNKNVFVDSCYLCGSSKNLESHHINFQKDFTDKMGQLSHKNKDKKHIIKNSESNIIVLCSKCHDDLHHNKISINTVIQTTDGIKAI
jgi:DNA mismatch repair protein MutS